MPELKNSSELRPAMASNGSSAPDPQQRKPVDNNNCSSAIICSITTQPHPASAAGDTGKCDTTRDT